MIVQGVVDCITNEGYYYCYCYQGGRTCHLGVKRKEGKEEGEQERTWCFMSIHPGRSYQDEAFKGDGKQS